MRLILSVLILVTLIACTKKRDEVFVQGQGKDLLQISDYDGKEFDVETLAPISKYQENPTVSKGQVTTDEKGASFTKMVAVETNTKAELLADAPFVALPNQKSGYKIRYQIMKDFLVVLKVAKKSLIHPQEAAGAFKDAKDADLLLVPIVGYPIKGFFNAEYVEENGAKTNKKTEITVLDKAGSKYFKIDKNGRTLYKLQEKLDLFSKEYFAGKDGESKWFFAQTIIAAGGENASYEGWVLAQQDAELNALSKVKFSFNQSEMRAVSINIDSKIKNRDDEINQTVLVKLPIEWKEYRAKPAGKNGIAMEEEEVTTIDWHKRSFVKVNFAGASTLAVNSSNFRFVDLEVEDNYFSFTLYEPQMNIRIKQSFMRDSGRQKYTPKRMLKEDFEKFGFFDTQKHEVDNYEKYKQEDYGKNIFINRYNVALKEIVFYFTEGSDDKLNEKLIPAAAKAADEWSKAFAKAGVPLKITVNTTERKRLGDVRFNQINLIRSAGSTNLFGYGPSITDPETGEIISATTNMHITSIVAHISSHIREYLLFQSGISKNMSLPLTAPVTPGTVALKGDKVLLQSEHQNQSLLKKFPVVGSNGLVEMKTIERPEAKPNPSSKLRKNLGREFDIGVTGKHLNKEIDQLCPELKPLADKIAKGERDEKENEMVVACAEKVVPHKMFGTLLHEMGHNFGLRHNFYGSVDAMNFLSKEETETEEQVQSSSVMEYSSFGEDRLTKVGKYDIAAIRYGYGDAVETKDGEIIKLDTNKTIAENLKGKIEKPYLFCTDEDVMVGTDPLCARHDAGTTPDQVVSHLIAEYNASIARNNYRMGRYHSADPMSLTQARIQRYWIPLKRIYDEWRFQLADHLGTGNEYLENFDAAKLDQAVAEKTKHCKMEENPNSSDCRFLQYKKAADKIFQFAMQIATLPPKYCVGTRNNKIAAVEFADVRRIIMTVNKFVPDSCLNDQVKKYVLEKYSFTPTPELESGYELEDVRLDMKVKMSKTKFDWYGNPLPEPPDIIGLMPEKMIAVEVLAVRTPLSLSSADKQFLPNFLDEPRYREQTLTYLADRLTKGIGAEKLLANKKIEFSKDLFLEKYKYEKRYIDNMVSSVFYGLQVPDKAMATKQRKRKFLVKYTDKKEILDKAKYKVLGLDGTTYYAIMTEEATEAKKLLQMLETLPKRMEAASPLDGSTFLGLTELSKNTLDAESKKVDVSKFIEFFYLIIQDEVPESLGVARTKEQQAMDKYRVHWKKAFQKETAVVRELFGEFSKETTDRPNPMDAIPSYTSDIVTYKDPSSKHFQPEKGFLSGKYDKIAEIIFDPNYRLDQKAVAERIEAYQKTTVQAAKSEQNDDAFNYEELKTQMEMILDVLRNMTDY